jgi:outer membrane lipoprotein-sorting protein
MRTIMNRQNGTRPAGRARTLALALALASLTGLAGPCAPAWRAAAQSTGTAPSTVAAAPSAAEILARLDANLSFSSIRYTGRIEISIGGATRTKSMTAMAIGRDKAFVEFTNPEDRGTRYLKLGQDLWMYFPREADTVKISGHLLKEGMMGSDMSYEDALESRDYSVMYTASVRGRETVDGRDCWVVELTATVRTAPYERRVIWIDAERWISVKEEMYARSGKLLKTSRVLEARRMGQRWFPVKSELVSALRSGTRTVFYLDEVELDPVLDQRQFTMAALTK